MTLTRQSSKALLALASQVMGDPQASDEAKLLAATVLAEAPLPRVKREPSKRAA